MFRFQVPSFEVSSPSLGTPGNTWPPLGTPGHLSAQLDEPELAMTTSHSSFGLVAFVSDTLSICLLAALSDVAQVAL